MLHSSKVAAILLHRWADWNKGGGAVADALEQTRSDGLATVIGASVQSPAELVAALGDSRVGYVQLPFNLLDRRWLEDDVQAALTARPDVICTTRSVFLQGLLAMPDTARWPANLPDDIPAVRAALDQIARELGRSGVPDLAVAYVRGHSFVTSVVIGAESTDQVRSQAELMRRPPLTPAEIERVREVVPAGSTTLVDPSTWKME